MSPTRPGDVRGHPAAPLARLTAGTGTALAGLVLAMCLPGHAAAQDLTLSLGDGGLTGVSLQLIVLLTLLSFAPALVITVTCFPFIVTVLAILRQAIGLQQSPPNMLIVALALFLSWYVMEPVLTEAWTAGLQPLVEGTLPPEQAFAAGIDPFRTFMGARVDLDTLARMSELRGAALPELPRDTDLSILVPSFLLSEIARAFQVGFLIFMPFLIIDLVVAAVLMSMGMMMVPPAIVSLPFKLAFFVVADGWAIVSEALVTGYL
jgi:flagellar biosynthetic protein FliP